MLKYDKNITKQESMAEYLRIRKYVIDQVIATGRERKRLLSMREMAAMFGVSLTTIQWALKELIDDGYLIAKKREGIFTNPEKAWVTGKVDVIGVLVADGRQIYFEQPFWGILSGVGLRTTETRRLLHQVNLFFTKNKGVDSFQFSQLDGLVWVAPDFAPSDLAESFFKSLDVPVVTVFDRRPGCSHVSLDAEREGYEVGKMLLMESRFNPIVLAANSEVAQLTGLRRAFGESGRRLNEKLILYRHEDATGKFRMMLDVMENPEAIYAVGRLLDEIGSVLEERRLDYDRCRLAGEAIYWQPGYRGWRVNRDYLTIGRLAAEQLLSEMSGGSRGDTKLHCEVVALGVESPAAAKPES